MSLKHELKEQIKRQNQISDELLTFQSQSYNLSKVLSDGRQQLEMQLFVIKKQQQVLQVFLLMFLIWLIFLCDHNHFF